MIEENVVWVCMVLHDTFLCEMECRGKDLEIIPRFGGVNVTQVEARLSWQRLVNLFFLQAGSKSEILSLGYFMQSSKQNECE